MLAQHCLNKHRWNLNPSISTFSDDAINSLRSYDYPGNVRELGNLIERALILSTGDQIEDGDWLPVSLVELTSLSKAQLVERAQIKRLLNFYHGNLVQVAQALKMSRTTLWRRVKEYCLQSDSMRDPDVSE